MDASGAGDADPWSEFLSESSEEFQNQPADASSAGSREHESASATRPVAPRAFDATPSPISVGAAFVPVSAPPPARPIEPPQARENAIAPSAANPISLADVVARQIPVHWAEAVATIEGLCAVLIDPNSPRIGIPELADVMITSAGTVMIRRGASGDRDLRCIARRLHALLAAPSTPLPLRLFVTSSIASERYRTIELYAEALSYYEAPGRTELIQALHARILEELVSSPLAPVPDDSSNHIESRARDGMRRRTPLWMIAGAAALVGVAATGVAMWRGVLPAIPGASAEAQSSDASTPPVDAAAAVERAASAPVPEREFARARAPRSGDSGSREPVRDDWAPGQILVPSARRAVGARPEIEVTKPPVPSYSATVPPIESVPVGAAGQPINAPASLPSPVPSVPERASVTQQDLTIYSQSDSDVQPPVPISVQLSARPDPPSADSRVNARITNSTVSNTLELIIDERGNVQSARLLPPARMADAWLPQAAKNMKFKPALKNNQPVKYRLHMNWTSTPG
jgi:hypothetical protein